MLEASGQSRAGRAASEQLLNACDAGFLHGLVAWHTLPIVAYYHRRRHPAPDTAAMMDALLGMLEVPTVTHGDAPTWRVHGVADFEDALQVASALAGNAAALITRNTADFAGAPLPVLTPEAFLVSFPLRQVIDPQAQN